MPAFALPTPRRAVLTCVFAAATLLGCAALMSAAVLAPAPPAAVPLIVAVCLGLPLLAAHDVPTALLVLRASREKGLRRRHLGRLRRQLERLPETRHPLDL